MSGKRKMGMETMIALILGGIFIIALVVEILLEFPLLFTITGFAAIGIIGFIVWYIRRENTIGKQKDKEEKKK